MCSCQGSLVLQLAVKPGEPIRTLYRTSTSHGLTVMVVQAVTASTVPARYQPASTNQPTSTVPAPYQPTSQPAPYQPASTVPT